MTTGRCLRLHGLAGLVDEELHAIEFEQQIVGELDIRLVDLVDQQDDRLRRLEGIPELAVDDVVGDVMDPRVAQLAVAQPRDRVVFVESLLGLGGRFDVPLDQRQAQRRGDLEGQHGLAGAGLALDQQRPLQGDGGVDGDLEVARGDVAGRAAKALAQEGFSVGAQSRSEAGVWPAMCQSLRDGVAMAARLSDCMARRGSSQAAVTIGLQSGADRYVSALSLDARSLCTAHGVGSRSLSAVRRQGADHPRVCVPLGWRSKQCPITAPGSSHRQEGSPRRHGGHERSATVRRLGVASVVH